MPTIEASALPNIFHQAEHELGAFLRAAAGLVGSSGLARAGDLWINTMEEAGCPGADLAKFFRSVTIRVVGQLSRDSESWRPAPGERPVDNSAALAA